MIKGTPWVENRTGCAGSKSCRWLSISPPDASHLKCIVQIFTPLGKPLHHAEHRKIAHHSAAGQPCPRRGQK